MNFTRQITLFSLSAALVACGGGKDNDDNNNNDGMPVFMDASVQADAPAPDIDAPIDGPELPEGCDFAELADATNDNILNMAGVPEATGLSFSAATTTVCGAVNTGHFDDMNQVVDIDTFTISVAANSRVLLTMQGAGIETLGEVNVFIDGEDSSITAPVYGNQAVANGSLAAGEYTITVLAFNPTAPAADVSYKVKIVPDDPDTRCATATAAADFTEANDGANNTGNDMVDVRFSGDAATRRVLTAAVDSAEPTGLTMASGTTYRLSGSSANVDAADEYHDRDSYFFTTGPTTDQLSVRINWTNVADFDFMLFPATSVSEGMIPEVASGTLIGQDGAVGEFATFPVKPNTSYWLWLGSYDDANVILPATYDVTVCAEAFVP